MKKIAIALIGGCLFLYWAVQAGASPVKRYDALSKTCRIFTHADLWAGYKIFRKNCKRCHFRGNKKQAKFLYTESKVRKGWDRVFATKYPPCAKDGSWGKLTGEQLARLNDYLFKNAADTYDPYDATDCG
ncbi:MAG: hypothetical protein GXP59_06745 [Deltaproteobacteria bacterium]|nr:hypothetical protein [Deltaproteobacteria bacterium]